MMPKAPMSMPMGNMPKPGGMPTGAAPAGAPSGAATEGASPEQVRAGIMTVLQRAKALAERSGIDWNELVAELGGAAGRAGAPPPPTGMGGGMMGGGMPGGGMMPPG